jgi:hypothetical protein
MRRVTPSLSAVGEAELLLRTAYQRLETNNLPNRQLQLVGERVVVLVDVVIAQTLDPLFLEVQVQVICKRTPAFRRYRWERILQMHAASNGVCVDIQQPAQDWE